MRLCPEPSGRPRCPPERPDPSSADVRDRLDLHEKLVGRQGRDADQGVGRQILGPEELCLCVDQRHQVVLAAVADDVGRDLHDVGRPGADGGQPVPEVLQDGAGLGDDIVGAQQLAVLVVGHLPRDVDRAAPFGGDDVVVAAGRIGALGVGAGDHGGAPCLREVIRIVACGDRGSPRNASWRHCVPALPSSPRRRRRHRVRSRRSGERWPLGDRHRCPPAP